jgi:hypothetical protein
MSRVFRRAVAGGRQRVFAARASYRLRGMLRLFGVAASEKGSESART